MYYNKALSVRLGWSKEESVLLRPVSETRPLYTVSLVVPAPASQVVQGHVCEKLLGRGRGGIVLGKSAKC